MSLYLMNLPLLHSPFTPYVGLSIDVAQTSTALRHWLPSNPDEIRKAVLTATLAVLVTLLGIFFKSVAAAFRTAIHWLWERIKIDRAQEARYRKSLAKSLRTVQILGMAQAKDLEAIYIPLKLGEWTAPDLLETHSKIAHETISLNEALEQFERITIVGGPGSGKTTITSHAAAALADCSTTICGKKYFPVYVQLRDLRDLLDTKQDKTLRDIISQSLRTFFPRETKLLDRKLDDGSCLLVLDGFDEIADREGVLQHQLSRKLADFTLPLPSGNRIVLTSRVAGYRPSWFPGFRVLEMSDLTLPQATKFIGGWFGKNQESWSISLCEALSNSERLQILVTNPLMLAIVCFVHGSGDPGGQLPSRRVDLYERCIDALTQEWDRSRGVDRAALFRPQEIESVLRLVAYEALLLGKLDFSHMELLALIRSSMLKRELRQYEDENFLREVLEHTGLFKEKTRDTVGFIHLTFQEYLAAQVIAERVMHGMERGNLQAEASELAANVHNPLWAEPIALAAGILRGRPELVTFLYHEYRRRMTPELQILLGRCLRDADLANMRFDQDYLGIQDHILSEIIEAAFPSKAARHV
jgi:hypothetical protein